MSAMPETTPPLPRWSVGGAFLEALTNRDFEALTAALSDDIELRAMLPRGAVTWNGAADVAETFEGWFGSAEDFEPIDATVGEVGGKLHLSWRFRLRPAPFGKGEGWHVIEQQAYADAGDTIDRLDLLCSGFRPDRTVSD